jgi:ribosomal protein S18 acetylase RimI-like enzyme
MDDPAFLIRTYRQDNAETVVALWQRCGLVVPHNDPRKDIARKLRADPDGFLIGERDGILVATCMVGYEGHRGWINYLAVEPSLQKQGYARRMMDEAERRLRELGCPKISLQVRATNSAVIDFYQRLGFTADNVISLGKRLESDL